MSTILALHHKYMKLVKTFVIACSVRKSFWSVDLSNERAESEIAVEEFGRQNASAMSKSVMPSGAKNGKVSKEKKRKNLAVLAKTPRLKRFFPAKLLSSNVETVALLTRAPENVGQNQDKSFEAPFTLGLAGHIDMLFISVFCLLFGCECCFLSSHSCPVVFNVGEIAPPGAISCVVGAISCVVGAILWLTRFWGRFRFPGGRFLQVKTYKRIASCRQVWRS